VLGKQVEFCFEKFLEQHRNNSKQHQIDLSLDTPFPGKNIYLYINGATQKMKNYSESFLLVHKS
jgi:hypothetical protein